MLRRRFAWVFVLVAFIAFLPVLHTHPAGKAADVCGTCAGIGSQLMPARIATEAPAAASPLPAPRPEPGPGSFLFAPIVSSRPPPAA